MSNIYKKQQVIDVIEQASQFSQQVNENPIIIQSTQSKNIPSNERYHKLNAVFQRFVARASMVSQNAKLF